MSHIFWQREQRHERFLRASHCGGLPVFWEREDSGDPEVSIEQWRRHYNEVRPHSSLRYLTPAAFNAKRLADVDGGRSPALPADHPYDRALTGRAPTRGCL